MGTWDPDHGHARVDLSACAYSDASHTMGPITYCGTQSHTHKTRHFHYGGDGCHAVADAHPTDPLRYTGANACANWKADVNKAIQSASSTYPLPPRATDCGSLGTLLKETVGSVKGGIDSLIDGIWKVLEYHGEKIEERDDRKFAQLDAELRQLHETYNRLPAPAQAAASTLACAPAGLLAAGAVTAGTKNPVAGATGGVAVDATCAAGIAAWAAADYQSFVFVNSQDDDSGDGTDGTDDSDDSDDSTGTDDDGSGEDADPEPEADPKPTAAEIKQNDDELNEAARRYRDEEITLAEYQAAFRRWMRWRCEEMGQTKWCNR